MRPIPKKLLEEMLEDPFYKTCIRRKTTSCGGRITLEHAIIYAGRQVNEKWAILPVCERHHGVNGYQDCGDLDKRFHEWVALNRMTPEDEAKYPRGDWERKRKHLNKIYAGEKCPVDIQG